MALLKSIDNVPGIDYYDYRDQDYYGKYVYRVRVTLPCVRYTWSVKTPEELDTKLSSPKKHGSVRKSDLTAYVDNLPALKEFVKYRNNIKENKLGIVRIESNTIAVFSNDLQMLKNIESIDPSLKYDYTEAQKSEYAGIKHFVNEPTHKFRIYLRSKRIPESFPAEIKELLGRMSGLYPSNALVNWLKDSGKTSGYWKRWNYVYANPGHFIDYDDESTLSYLMLLYGDFFGKRYRLEKRPDTE